MIFRAGFSENYAEVKKGESVVKFYSSGVLFMLFQCGSYAKAKAKALQFTARENGIKA
ncbi:MAG: hypothetical protein Q9M19_01335 [Mariprofundaceae bacterium]|nr:hypothetical protein [Mariprofundaceae bacterium]